MRVGSSIQAPCRSAVVRFARLLQELLCYFWFRSSVILDPLSLLSCNCLRGNRHAVQAEARMGVKRLLACVRQQLSALDDSPQRSAGVVRPITAAMVSLARQVNAPLGSLERKG